MRASEFVTEARGKIGARRQMPTRGLNIFWDGTRTDSDYTLNRVMMAVACADGTDAPIEINDMSWIGRDRSAHPYTDEEQQMMKQAYKAVGAVWKDLNDGDMNSQEVESTNTTSPVKGFRGYPR
jgi:hypothetical protein